MQGDSTCTAYNIIDTLPVLVYISTSVQSTPVYCCVYAYSVYAVIVAWGALIRDNAQRRRRQDDNLRSPRDIIADMNNTLPPPYPPMPGMTIYTAALWSSAAAVPDDFIVGNGSVTMGPDGKNYTNARLQEGTRYGVFNFIQLESDIPVS